jgi:nicotinamidase/pyrazinamidase
MKALLVVDMQNDFMPGGALGVPGANEIVPLINRLMESFTLVVATQDWHPPDHTSFAPNHPGKKVGDIVMVKGIEQILWPVHCVRNTLGAELVEGLNKDPIASIFYKGTDRWIDSYSAFFDNARRKSTGLGDYLESRQVKEFTLVGVATDYCVLYSTIDALDLGFSVTVVQDACRGINLMPGDVDAAFGTMAEKGARIISSRELLEDF